MLAYSQTPHQMHRKATGSNRAKCTKPATTEQLSTSGSETITVVARLPV